MARTPMERVDCLVVGAGVVGLAVARALALKGREVLVCEREGAVGQGTTSRNSEVIHAGLYYKPGSLKARLCVQGREALYQFCGERGIPHRRCGKLVVASAESQLPALRELHERAKACGVKDVRLLGGREARVMEPHVLCTEERRGDNAGARTKAVTPRGCSSCRKALFSPSTGIVDSHALTLSLQGDAEAAGAVVALRTPVHYAEVLAGGGILVGAEGLDLRCRTVVNCAGLSAVRLAQRVLGSNPESLPEAFFAKGSYFRYTGPSPFRHLVYPMPEPYQAGLGVHATLDLSGQVRFGPDVEWITKPTTQQRQDQHRQQQRPGFSREAFGGDGFDYRVDPNRSVDFYNAIRRYWPDVDESQLVPDYSGIRPKLVGPSGSLLSDDSDGHGRALGGREDGVRNDRLVPQHGIKQLRGSADFMIQGRDEHGVDGLVNLMGIESPGLTASLAIADHVVELLRWQEA